MKIATTILAVLLGLLSCAAGAAKVALVPEEVAFLQQFGFTDSLAIGFGVIQILCGLLLFVPATRLYGAVGAALGFSLSVVLILSTGKLLFAAASSVPVVLLAMVIYQGVRQRNSEAS